ncbi:2OG-Fe dioxygenase family protein [Thalassotalea ganghwensis]
MNTNVDNSLINYIQIEEALNSEFKKKLSLINLQHESGNRARATANAIVCAKTKSIIPLDGIKTENGEFHPYCLPKNLNSDYNGNIRYYNCMNKLMNGESFWDLDLIINLKNQLLDDHPIIAPYYALNVMIISYQVDAKTFAQVTPNHLHFDELNSDTRSCVYTVERNNVRGGSFAIASGKYHRSHINEVAKTEFLFHKAIPEGQGIILDERVSIDNLPVCHSATETYVDNPKLSGTRTILVTEMKPIFPIIH